MQNLIRSFSAQGIDPRGLHIDWSQFRETALRNAERDVRAMFILDRVANQAGVEPSDEDVEAEIQRMADSLNQPVEQLRARLTKEGGADSIKNQMRSRKALDLVVDAAQVTVQEVEGLGARAAEDQDAPQASGEPAAEQGE